MTSGQVKRIRTRLEKAAKLTQEANTLLNEFQPSYGSRDHHLTQIVTRAADDMMGCMRNLDHYDTTQRLKAATARWERTIEPGARVAEVAPYQCDKQVKGHVVCVNADRTTTIRLPDGTTVDRETAKLFRIPERA